MPLKLRIFRIARSAWRGRPARVRAVFTASAQLKGSTTPPKLAWSFLCARRFSSARGLRRVTPKQRMLCFHSQGGCCNDCKLPLANGFHVDHIFPKSLGGGNEPANLQALHPECHRKKTQEQNPVKFLRILLERDLITRELYMALSGFPPAAALLPPPQTREVICSENQLVRAASTATKPEKQLSTRPPMRALRSIAITALSALNRSSQSRDGPCTGC